MYYYEVFPFFPAAIIRVFANQRFLQLHPDRAARANNRSQQAAVKSHSMGRGTPNICLVRSNGRRVSAAACPACLDFAMRFRKNRLHLLCAILFFSHSCSLR